MPTQTHTDTDIDTDTHTSMVSTSKNSKGWDRKYNIPPCRTTDQLLPHEHSYDNSNDITTV